MRVECEDRSRSSSSRSSSSRREPASSRDEEVDGAAQAEEVVSLDGRVLVSQTAELIKPERFTEGDDTGSYHHLMDQCRPTSEVIEEEEGGGEGGGEEGGGGGGGGVCFSTQLY